jgi:signal recognition particle subunit SRP72
MGKSGGKGAEAPGDGGAEVGARLESLFATLEEQLRAFAVHKALHTCDQILALAPADPDALHAKVAALVHADQCSEALAVLHAQPAVAALMPFEKAYCLYRTARHKEALALLQDSEQIPAEHTAGATHLRAQLQYRAGAFDDCIRTYESAQQARARATRGGVLGRG